MSVKREVVPVRSGTTAEWASGPVLDVGELGVDITTGKIRIGDGVTAFASLPTSGGVTVGRAVLVAGTATVANTAVVAATNIFVQHQILGTVAAAKVLTITRSNGVSFTITSTDATDTSTIAYMIEQP